MLSRVAYQGERPASHGFVREAPRGTLSLSRGAVIGAALALLVATAWAGVASWYILTKDDLASRLIRRETARQYAYEDRIAGLRHEIDRLSSRQLLDQDSVEYRLTELVNRQSQLESREAIVTAIAGQFTAAPSPTAPTMRVPDDKAAGETRALGFAPLQFDKPMPAPEPPALRGSNKPLASALQSWQSTSLNLADAPIDAILGTVSTSISKVETAQIKALHQFDATIASQQSTMKTAIADIGLDPEKLGKPAASSAQGGPFIPVALDPAAGPFEATLAQLQPRLASVERLRSVVTRLPLRKPLPGEPDQTSGFGYRTDPFLGRPALHSGLDFRAEIGSPVRATAPGRVVTAEYTGGYGNMVEIEHENGLSTRYGHLSAILVSEGQTVPAGAIVGRVGSTGRSTGPHLHYETRIDGDAVNPQRFLKAGRNLVARAPELLEPPQTRRIRQAAGE